jgi:hypothetical protein
VPPQSPKQPQTAVSDAPAGSVSPRGRSCLAPSTDALPLAKAVPQHVAPQFGMDTAQRDSLSGLIMAAAAPSTQECMIPGSPPTPASPVFRFGAAIPGDFAMLHVVTADSPVSPAHKAPPGSTAAAQPGAERVDGPRVSADSYSEVLPYDTPWSCAATCSRAMIFECAGT